MKHGALTGAVGADQTAHLSAFDGERDFVHGGETAVRLGQAFHS
jgi:hypothetical protein